MSNLPDYVYGEEAASLAGFQKTCHFLRVIRKHAEAYEHDTGRRVETVMMKTGRNWSKAVLRSELEAFLEWYAPIRNKNPRNGGRAARSIVINPYKTGDAAERKRRQRRAWLRGRILESGFQQPIQESRL